MEREPDLTLTARKRNQFTLEAMTRRFGVEAVQSSALSVLDLGCGGGDLAEALGRAGVRGLLGIDIDADAIATARRRCGRYGHRFESLPVEEFDSPPLYDVVVMSEVVACLNDPGAVLRAIRGWVKPGGLFVLTCCNSYGPWAFYRRWVERGLKNPARSALGRHVFSFRSLKRAVEEAGFYLRRGGNSNFLSAVYPFSVSRYRPWAFGFIERWDICIANYLPRWLASGWNLSLVAGTPPRARREARARVDTPAAVER